MATLKRTRVQGNILAKHKNNATEYLIGGNGGNAFKDAKYSDGIVVATIEAWAGDSQLNGIRITFSDKSQIVHGHTVETYCGSINIDYWSDERVTELSIWGNGAGTRCGAFRIKTSSNKIFFPQMTVGKLKTEYKMNIGGGIILGVIGRAGGAIDSLGFLMLDQIDHSVLTDLKYSLSKIPKPEQKFAFDTIIPNPSTTNSDSGSVVQEITIERGGEWFIKAGGKFGQEYKVTGGFPQVAEGQVTNKWEVSVEAGYTGKWNESWKQSISIPLIAPALTKTRIAYSYFHGKVDSCPFVATTKHYMVGGGEWDCEVTGVYDGVDTTHVVGTSYLIARWDKNKNDWVEFKTPQKKIIN